ncbi:MAG TPA: Crp/Fnr family transcriptional regulator [Candidatus Scatomonas merdavium]|nr:Crp/Fnr family transcriptional regulator [Candidatus Scatomonas merdavium]
MKLSEYFPVWDQLTEAQQNMLEHSAVYREIPKGTLLHNGELDCLGMILVESGRLRAYIVSEEGKEITIYRLLSRDICLFSASCMMKNIQFEVTVEAETEAAVRIIPPSAFRGVMEESAAMANYMNELMAGRLSDVVWLMEQVMWKSFDSRLAAFLLEESALEESDVLKITQEKIADHLGTAREVVTRMLRYFQGEGAVKLSRGTIEILDRKKLEATAR